MDLNKVFSIRPPTSAYNIHVLNLELAWKRIWFVRHYGHAIDAVRIHRHTAIWACEQQAMEA